MCFLRKSLNRWLLKNCNTVEKKIKRGHWETKMRKVADILSAEELKYDDTNAMFVKPEKFDFRVTSQDAKVWATQIMEKIK